MGRERLSQSERAEKSTQQCPCATAEVRSLIVHSAVQSTGPQWLHCQASASPLVDLLLQLTYEGEVMLGQALFTLLELRPLNMHAGGPKDEAHTLTNSNRLRF